MRPAEPAFIGLAVVVTGVTSYFAFLPATAGTIAFWAIAVGPTMVLAALAAAWAQREGLLRGWLSLKGLDITIGVLGAAFFFGVAWAFARWAAPVGSTREIWLVSLYGEIGDPRVLEAHAPAIAAMLAAAALAEEILWRGTVTQMLADLVGSRTAWLWSAGLYALAHAPAAWSLRSMATTASWPNPVLPLAALGGGLLWGGIARVKGRLAPNILAHALFDWAVVMMLPLWAGKQPVVSSASVCDQREHYLTACLPVDPDRPR